MSLSDLLGLKSRLRRLRILAGEGALAAEDRAQLLKLAWDEEKKRLGTMLGVAVAVIGLTTVAIALLSVAIVVHFWDTPYRTMAAWVLAFLWVGLWAAAVLTLVGTMRKSSAFASARQTFERDLEWFHERFGAHHQDEELPDLAVTLSSEQLLARIERQRQRIATLEAAAAGVGDAPVSNESATAAALRIAREHPVATGVATAAVIAVLGPRRVVRWISVVAPVLWRMRG
jgi:uncharacterized membrane protein YqjE